MDLKQMSAVILAGGRSSRMGENKLLLPLGDKPLIGHLINTLNNLFVESILVTDHPHAYQGFAVRTTADLICCPEKNSLAGIHAGLVAASQDYCLVVAGDMPFICPDVLKYLANRCDGYDVTIIQEGVHFQPLCAIYHKNCIPYMEKLLRRNHYKILDFFPDVRVTYVDSAELLFLDPNGMSFFNVNTPVEYQKAIDFYTKRVEGEHNG